MSKGILEFDLSDYHERLEFRRANSATDAYIALHEISNCIFRPVRKHGYPNPELQKLSDKLGEDFVKIMDLLENKFYQILEARKVDLDDLE